MSLATLLSHLCETAGPVVPPVRAQFTRPASLRHVQPEQRRARARGGSQSEEERGAALARLDHDQAATSWTMKALETARELAARIRKPL